MDSVAVEKETAMQRYRRLQKLRTLLRCVEAAAVVLLLSWSSFRIPAAARISGDLLRRLVAFLLSPRCVFLIGNAIVLVLIYNSGKLSSPFFNSSHSSSPSSADDSSTTSAGGGDLYEEFLETRGRLSYALPPSQPAATEEVVFEDKAVCVETRRICRRSRSDRMDRRRKVPPPELRRAETDVGRKGSKTPPVADAMEEEVEDPDPEEFRRTIEAFIARQTKFHRDESMAIVSADSGAGTPKLLCSAGSPELETILKQNDVKT